MVSYYTGPYSSYIKVNEDVRWTTPSFYVDLTPTDVTVKVPTKGSISRSSPSMLDENTMFYMVSSGVRKEHNSCIFRATATGDFPKKKWIESKTPVHCIKGEDRFGESNAPDMADAQAFKDHIGNNWLVFGKDFSGIYLIILDVETGTASKNSEKWTMD